MIDLQSTRQSRFVRRRDVSWTALTRSRGYPCVLTSVLTPSGLWRTAWGERSCTWHRQCDNYNIELMLEHPWSSPPIASCPTRSRTEEHPCWLGRGTPPQLGQIHLVTRVQQRPITIFFAGFRQRATTMSCTNFSGYVGHINIFSWMLTVACRLVTVTIRFRVWLVSGYVHVSAILSVVAVTLLA